VKLLQEEIDTEKSKIINLHEKIQLFENNMHTSNKSLLNRENRMSELFNNYADTNTKISILGQGVSQLKVELEHIITGIFDNSLPNHGSYISELNSRLLVVEGNYIKNN